jgi:hypothetical protein
MVGFITERDLEQAEQSFPGIRAFFAGLQRKPRTFLELIAQYEHWGVRPLAKRQ